VCQRSILLTEESGIDQGEEVLGLQLRLLPFLRRIGAGGEEGGDDDDWPASPASSRLLFFDAPVFKLFAGETFILQVIGVFTRIRLGPTEVGRLQRRAQVDLIY
jgi:hypothetical protein